MIKTNNTTPTTEQRLEAIVELVGVMRADVARLYSTPKSVARDARIAAISGYADEIEQCLTGDFT